MPVVAAGVVVSTVVAALCLLFGRHLLKVPLSWLMGLMAGIGTNPAVLTFAEDRAGNEMPLMAYSMVFPVAMVSKIVIAELLIQLLVQHR